jgi:hypothetical protein
VGSGTPEHYTNHGYDNSGRLSSVTSPAGVMLGVWFLSSLVPLWQGARREGRRAVWEHTARGVGKRNAATTGKNKPQ